MEVQQDHTSDDSEDDPASQDTSAFPKNASSKCNGMDWWYVKQISHRYLIEASNVKRNEIAISLPVPISRPRFVQQYQTHREVFKPKPQLDTRLKHYRKLFAKSNRKKEMRDLVNHNKFASLPQYLADTASGVFDASVDCPWCYSGGNLDLINIQGETFAVYAGFHEAITIKNLKTEDECCCFPVKEILPVYNIKAQGSNSNLFTTRQKSKVGIFQLLPDPLNVSVVWRGKSKNSFMDSAFNKYRENEITTIDDQHNVKIRDFVQNKEIASNYIKTDFKKVSDCLAQIYNIDANRTAFINRCCLYFLDWRSQDIQHVCLNQSWLKCDDLCSVFSNSVNEDILYLSSTHSVFKFDLRLLAHTDKALHMLSSPPFISTCSNIESGDIICLSGQTHSDKVLLHATSEAITTPIHIPSVKDTLYATALTNTLENLNYLENRLILPTLGMKLHGDTLFTLNTIEDLFEQAINSDENNVVEKALHWFNSVPYKPRPLEVTKVQNLNCIMNTITTSFSDEHMSKFTNKGKNIDKSLDQEYEKLKKCLETGVGEAMNAIWDIDTLLPESEDISTGRTKSKVSEWLASTR